MKQEVKELTNYCNSQLLLCEAKIETLKKAFSLICKEANLPDFESRYNQCLVDSFRSIGLDSLNTLPSHIARRVEEIQSLLRFPNQSSGASGFEDQS